MSENEFRGVNGIFLTKWAPSAQENIHALALDLNVVHNPPWRGKKHLIKKHLKKSNSNI